MALNTDRRRLAGPLGATVPIIYASTPDRPANTASRKRKRAPNEARKIFLQTQLTASASSSAYFELAPATSSSTTSLSKRYTTATPKLALNVHGPHPLSRTAPYSPTLTLSTLVKLSPFATSRRGGHIRTALERDLSAHIETALRGTVIAHLYPKTGMEVAITVLEIEDGDIGLFSLLAGAITAAGTALVDAGIECLDLVTGGMAALAPRDTDGRTQAMDVFQDPSSGDLELATAVCCVGYLSTRDELVEVWIKGDSGSRTEELINAAVAAAVAARSVAVEVLKEGLQASTNDRLVEQTGSEKTTH